MPSFDLGDGPKDVNAVFQALTALLKARDWNETHLVLEREQALLLTETAEQILQSLTQEARQSGTPDSARNAAYLMLHLTLLHNARLSNISTAWKLFKEMLAQLEEGADEELEEINTSSDQEDEHHSLVNPLQAWLSIEAYDEQRRFLEAHPELLDPRYALALEQTIMNFVARIPEIKKASGTTAQEMKRQTQLLRDRLGLIRDASQRGGTTSSIRAAYVNVYGGLVLDLPSWIEALLKQLSTLYQMRRRGQATSEHVKLLRLAIERANHEDNLAQEIVAALHALFFEALNSPFGESQVQEEGISCLEKALEVYTYTTYPHQYAGMQNNLGIAYSNRIAGEQSDNQEKAITCLLNALRVFTYKDFPKDYAGAQNNLGSLYVKRIIGEQRNNVEEAIACYNRALQIFTREDFPVDFAEIQGNLGTAYSKRISGDQQANLEDALACYRRALEIFTPDRSPKDYATAQRNMGKAYCKRISGDRQKYLEEGIACYKRALQIYTFDAFPEEHAGTLRNLRDAQQELAKVTGQEPPREDTSGEEQEKIALTRQEVERALYDTPFLVEKLRLAPNNPNIPAIREQLLLALTEDEQGQNSTPGEDSTIFTYEITLPTSIEVDTLSNEMGEAILTWLEQPISRKGRRFLQTHPELLDLRVDLALQQMMKDAPRLFSQARRVLAIRNLQACLNILQRARAQYGTIAAIRAAYVDIAGAFTLDLPEWLVEVAEQFVTLRDQGDLEQIVTLLRDALVRSQREGNVIPEILAELNLLLCELQEETTGANQRQAQEEGIAGLESALHTYTQERYPVQFARIQLVLGSIYQRRIEGIRRDNLETAITCYRRSLQIYTLDAFPIEHAKAQYSMGNAYRERMADRRQVNLENAITCYTSALRVYTRETFPVEYARTQRRLGNTYRERIEGDRQDNLTAAIISFQQALRVFTREAFPEDFALTQTNLGLALTDRVAWKRRDKAEVEEAIACHKRALQVFTREAFPEDFARVQNNLAIAYSERGEGDRRANQEEAIACYRRALEVYTRDAFPRDYAEIQYSLGLTYARTGGELRPDLEKALVCFTNALEVFTDLALDEGAAMAHESLNAVQQKLAEITGQQDDREANQQDQKSSLVEDSLSAKDGISPSSKEEAEHDRYLDAVNNALQALLTADTLEETRLILEQKQDLLLTEAARGILAALIDDLHKSGDQRQKELALYFMHYQVLLNEASTRGVAAAWDTFRGTRRQARQDQTESSTALPDNAPPTLASKQRLSSATTHDIVNYFYYWATRPTTRERRRFLETHLELLDPDRDDVLEFGLNYLQADAQRQYPTDEYKHAQLLRHVQDLRDHLDLLYDARKRGGTIEAVRAAFVNARGGFTLDIPPWLEEVEQQLYQFDTIPQGIVQTAEARVALLRQALARAQEETNLALEVLAELYSRLGHALNELDDTPHVKSRRQIQEEAISCLTDALQTYTFVQYPRQYARLQFRLGRVYSNRIEEKRRDNLEEAIACYKRALQIFILDAFPEEYAMIQNNLGNAYTNRIAGKRRDNLEEAIACYKRALQFHTLDAAPKNYALTQHSLGTAYIERIKGSRRANLEEAIAWFNRALQVYTIIQYPYQYAMTQSNLGGAYRHRIEGERRANLEEAIACFNRALQVYTLQTDAEGYAHVQVSLGTVYEDRIDGEKRANVEEAIACYKRALQIFTLDAFPEEYARTQNNLGNAYNGRIEGEPRTNQEEAIACFRRALQIFTLDAFPEEYARTQNNLGTAYNERIEGDRRANQEEAIACFRRALQVFTLEAFPIKYAMVLNNLGNTYGERIEGERRANQEEAIACYEQALRVYTVDAFPEEYARTQESLGNTYAYRIEGERQTNLEEAVACHTRALQIFTLNAFPFDHQHIQLNRAYIEIMRQNWEGAHSAYSGAHAAEDLLMALGAGTTGRDVILKEGRDAALRDGFVLTRLSRFSEAAMAIEKGRARGLAEAMALDTADPARISDVERRMRYINAHKALITAQATLNAPLNVEIDPDSLPNDPAIRTQIIDQAQRDAELKRTNDYHRAKRAFDAIVAEIRAAQDPAEFLEGTIDAAAILQAAKHSGLGHAIVYLAATPWGGIAVVAFNANPIRQTQARFDKLDLPQLNEDFINNLIEETIDGDEGQRLINSFAWAQSGNALSRFLYDWQGTTFRTRAKALNAACLAVRKTSTLNTTAQALLNHPGLVYIIDKSIDRLASSDIAQLDAIFRSVFLYAELERSMNALSNAVLRPLMEWLQLEGATSVTLIPCGWLAAFPLPTAEIAPGQTFGDLLPTSVAPNARSLLLDEGTETSRSGVYAVGDPRPTHQELRWSEAEAQTLVTLAHSLDLPSEVRVLERAKRSWLIEALCKGYIVDASCHGMFNSNDPLRSALILAQGEKLTLADMFNREADLRGLRLLILSACQTAVMDLRGALDEVRSLAVGMIQAGAKAVLASQWSVDDKATYLLMVRFAHEWLPHMQSEPPAAALARAQRWLRSVTNAELEVWQAKSFPQLIVKGQEDFVEAIRSPGDSSWDRYTLNEAEKYTHTLAARRNAPDGCPYADPIYWAGFQVTGW